MTQSIRTMVLGFRGAGVHVIFYNLRKPVLRSLRGTCAREDIVYCRSELEVYAHISSSYGDSDRMALLNAAAAARSARGWLSRSYAEC